MPGHVPDFSRVLQHRLFFRFSRSFNPIISRPISLLKHQNFHIHLVLHSSLVQLDELFQCSAKSDHPIRQSERMEIQLLPLRTMTLTKVTSTLQSIFYGGSFD